MEFMARQNKKYLDILKKNKGSRLISKEHALDAAGFQTAAVQRSDMTGNVVAADGRPGPVSLGGEALQIPAVCLDGIAGVTTFEAEIIEKTL